MHATKETKEAVYKSHVKVSSDMYATKETESHDDQIRPHIRPSATMVSSVSAVAENDWFNFIPVLIPCPGRRFSLGVEGLPAVGSCLSGYLNTCSSLNKKRRAH
jgi:hypothetical protein